jgi:hypothetical protein
LEQHYSVFADGAWKSFAQGLQFRWTRDNHIATSGSSCVNRNIQKELPNMKKVLALLFALALSVSMSSFAFAQADKPADKPMDKMDKPADKKEAKAKKTKKAKKAKKDEMKKDEAK